jgi:hypothetical protein
MSVALDHDQAFVEEVRRVAQDVTALHATAARVMVANDRIHAVESGLPLIAKEV